MDKPIQKLRISARLKEILCEMGFTTASELEAYNFFSLEKEFPDCYYFYMIMKELIPLGYLSHPEGEPSIYELSISERIKNVLSIKRIFYLSQLSGYSRKQILQFRNLGVKSMEELEAECQKRGICFRPDKKRQLHGEVSLC